MRNLIEPKNNKKLRFSWKIKSFFLIFCLLFVMVAMSPKFSQAQIGPIPMPTMETVSVPQAAAQIKLTFWENLQLMLQKAGSIAFQRTLSTALNKIAYDTANYIGSGHSGQKPLFITQGWGEYLKGVGDAAAGTFIENYVNNLNSTYDESKDCDTPLQNCKKDCLTSNSIYEACLNNCNKDNTACAAGNVKNTAAAMRATPSFNVCSPSSLMAKVKIGLGLVEQNQPTAPNCTLSKMIKTWDTDINQKLKDLREPNYLSNLASYFDPQANDLGISILAKTDLQGSVGDKLKVDESKLLANKGWLNVTNIAGDAAAPPGTAERTLQEADNVKNANLGKITGDVFVDAANVFLNQLAVSAFNKLIQSLGKQDNGNNAVGGGPGYSSDPNSGRGATALKQITTTLLKPNFGTQADYDILSSLMICLDPKNPGPDNCVVDSSFQSAISEKKTVAEAIIDGSLHGEWQVTNSDSGDAYNSEYSLRNINILIKYRILPIGWAEAASIATNPREPHRATLNDLISCFDPNDQYTNFSQGFVESVSCPKFIGLVDPNWVLKAPLNYCQKEGFGAQILSTTVMPGSDTNPPIPSTLNILRADNYCADGQTCIKEKANGSCEAYGYCNGEKRTWNFNTDSCEPVNNTCQSFTGVNGQAIAYLQNTLDYNNCNSGNAGCRQYSLSGLYATSTGTVSWTTAASLYLNKSLGTCSSSDNGCTELMRVKSTWGNNLVMDSDFNNEEVGDASNGGAKLNDWPLLNSVSETTAATIVDTSLDPGIDSGKAIKLSISNISGGIYSNSANSLLPANFQIVAGQSYTVSADVYGDNVSLFVGDGNNYRATTVGGGSWQHLSVTRSANSSYNDPSFKIVGEPGIFYVKNLKFEMSNWDTGYSSYGQTPSGSAKIYEKLLPNYLEKACYNNVSSAVKDYTLKSDAPAACSTFARKCNQDEAGCDSYTNVKDKFTVAAKVVSGDYCPQECLGYDIFISKGSYFNSSATENLIPATANKCSAAAVGCSEFTNLDSLAQGGEQKEYYTSLKQCIKPSPTQCASFYAWQGQASGYQLQAYSLEKDINGLPAITSGGVNAPCDATVYNLPVSDANFNPDCRQFYNATGTVAYRLVSRTITCSDNCHTYRMTDKNIDSSVTETNCTGTNKHWNGTSCQVCLNGGTWDATSGSCFYNAIPGEGQTCSAQENGCREYNGNTGSNVRLISYDDFENGLNGWSSNCGVSISPVSNNKNGHSLYSPASCEATSSVSGLVNQGSAYTLKFLGLAPADTTLTISFRNKDTGTTTDFSSLVIKGGSGWNIYQANLAELNQSVGNNEELVISGGGEFYLDNFVLSEISDRYYLIKNSSQIPDSCYYDISGSYQGADYNLGCAQYTDRNNLKNNLHKFTKLCSDSAVGCEQMIDTKNYSPSGSGFWEGGIATTTCSVGTDPNCVYVPGDSALYAVYDAKKQCNSVNLGCSRLGQGQGGKSLIGFSDVFKLNNPNQYETILCNSGDVGCETWTNKDNNSVSYFKDPGNNVCVYRAAKNATVGPKKWYKIPAKRCKDNLTGPICLSDNDCGTGVGSCAIDPADHECDYSVFETIGLGGSGNEVPVPSSDAGECDQSASGCTEYIDSVTKFNPNLVNNPSFVETDGVKDGWGTASLGDLPAGIQDTQQVIALEPYKLYSLNVIGNSTSGVRLGFYPSLPVRQLLSDNNFTNPKSILNAASTPNTPVIFDSASSTATILSGASTTRTIEVRELVVNYQLQDKIDKASCAGQAQFNNGCVLFNERSINGASGLASLNYDAYATNALAATNSNPIVPAPCSGGSCTANEVIKVSPNRVCSRWLSCTSYTQDPITKKKTCYAYNECNSLDNQGECNNYTTPLTGTTTTAVDANATGYSLYNNYNLGQMEEVGINANIHYDFEGGGAAGCKINLTGANCGEDILTNSLIKDPDAAAEATDYPAHGEAYLRVPTSDFMFPGAAQFLDAGTYYINYLVNTRNVPSGVKARVIITDENNVILSDGETKKQLEFDSVAPNGWKREINKFNLSNSKKIIIYLSSNNGNPEVPGYVYFDDINIEMVLEKGDGQYVARDCRLYPTSDSLTCTSKNKNVVSEGLEGYCLAYDPANLSSCLMWYPIDRIGTTKNKSLISGYNGQFPLYYCVEVSGNFELVEYRSGYFLINDNDVCQDGGEVNQCSTFSGGAPRNKTSYFCNPNYFGVFSQHGHPDGDGCSTGAGTAYQYYVDWCLPKVSNLVSGISTDHISGFVSTQCSAYGYENGWGLYDGNPINPNGSNKIIKVYDKDNNEIVDLNKFRLKCNKFIKTVDDDGTNKVWSDRIATTTYANVTPPYFVSDTDKPYGKDYPNNRYNLDGYGRSVESLPFGAAQLSDNFLDSTSRILLRAKGSSDVDIAGRPYGCSQGSGSGCDKIGYCNDDPSSYCLVGFNSETCGNTNTCIPLWDQTDPLYTSPQNYSMILSKLFLQSFSGYKFSSGKYNVEANVSYNDYTNNGSNPGINPFGFSPYSSNQCAGGVRSTTFGLASFCPVYPIVSNPNLFFEDSSYARPSTGTTFNVNQKGVYRLQFNSKVDKEQQPLQSILINWGDGHTYTVTTDSQHPNPTDPHILYHYYRTTNNSMEIKITIKDNWGYFGSN